MRKVAFSGLILAASILTLLSCTKDRIYIPDEPDPNDTTTNQIQSGSLYINEFVAKGSLNQNEYGTASDWFEIYNPGNQAVTLTAGEWFVSDDAGTPNKFAISVTKTIPAHGFLVIWCDGLGVPGNDIHTDYSLSASGEDLVIYYDNGTTQVVVDSYTFGAQTVDAVSYGRSPDGQPNWIQFATPTPGQSNN
jgi:hypothetical protein